MNGSIRKMMRVTCGMLLMVMSGVSQAAELHLESRGGSGTQPVSYTHLTLPTTPYV